MSIIPASLESGNEAPYLLPEELPNYDSLITEDEKPVDSWYSERQHRLLTDALHVSWRTPGGRPHIAATDVALFFAEKQPPMAPDVMVSLDVTLPPDSIEKRNRSYFIWTFGKPPDGIVEVVSNQEGGELTSKLQAYARIHVPFYIVWDPYRFLGEQTLHCFKLDGTKYVPCDRWFPDLELGVTTWDGEYDGMSGHWMRWCDQRGKLLATGIERSADAAFAEQRADSAEQRAAKLAEKLRAMGIDPDA